ncbi:hypothetical protein PhCBS80983_g03878 [Powellomyces hirtus]|uniref:Signal peptidase complex catalytic subunit SEC11 n=1 Tax=Powellomyces hirtus TaxID=109895 RepID=A0A507E225_9FUNG|nr:hypothetical protein PhCBS80983_g03878 [Powellomyces hirtus]
MERDFSGGGKATEEKRQWHPSDFIRQNDGNSCISEMGGNKEKRVGQKLAAQKDKEAQVVEQKEAREGKKWETGAKVDKKQLEEQKKQEALQKKKEREALLAAEERELAATKPVAPIKGSAKKAEQRTAKHEQFALDARADIPEFAASGLDDALNLLDLAAGGAEPKSSDKIERHPEKRMKSAWAAFEEREMPLLKQEQPNLRLSQYKQALQKKWKKSPENPMNQQSVAFDTTRQEERELIESQREAALSKLRVNGSMRPAFDRGDLLFLSRPSTPFQTGDICIFNIDGKHTPIVHRVMQVHTRHNGTQLMLTKGDNNTVDDRVGELYRPGQMWIGGESVVGKVDRAVFGVGDDIDE